MNQGGRGRGRPDLRLRRRSAAAAALAAIVLLIWGSWIPAKAALAQVLIGRSFDTALRTGEATPPWSWADTAPVARLTVPRLGVERFVLAGASGPPLAFGPGHMTSTTRPGKHGNAVIAGHRDTHFAFLEQLVPGDEIMIETTKGEQVRYAVTWTHVVEAIDTWVAAPTDERLLTLVTCYPFGGLAGRASERYVVRAASDDRVVPTSAQEAQTDAETTVLW